MFSVWFRHIAGFLLQVVMLSAGVHLASDTATAAATPLNRDVLGLYDSRHEKRLEETRLHRWLEMPLNHLGYKLTFHDIAKGLPPVDLVRQSAAIVTWFHDAVPDPRGYFAWAKAAARAGKRFMVLESPGMLAEKKDLPLINSFMSELGVSFADFYVTDTAQTRILAHDESMAGFEHKLDAMKLPEHQVVVAAPRGGMKVHLALTDPSYTDVNAPHAAAIVTGPKGGFILTGFAVDYRDETDRVRWIVDPFRFIEAALGAKLRPIPDTTTVSGRRLYFSHIDGDGWNNVTDVEPYDNRGGTAGEAMADRLIAAYPDLPVSVGLIGGDADLETGGEVKAVEVAKSLFSMAQVEVASHTYTHPYIWEFFENYDRKREVSDVLRFTGRPNGYDDRSLTALVNYWRNTTTEAYNHDPATAIDAGAEDNADLPRARPHEPFDIDLEVSGALDLSTSLAPPGKRALLYLWSGNTRPFERALKAVREAGARNMNGGDSRFDSVYNSAAYVAPLSRVVGHERQIYAVNSNENTYTNSWTGPYDAFALLSETLDNTERPRRLKGFNLYYHAFSATKKEGLAVIEAHLERARHAAVAPVAATRYAAIAEGFFSATITEIGRDRWHISNRDALETLRFDDAAAIEPDYKASRGVIGHTHHQGALYVALDPAASEVFVALSRLPGKAQRSVHLIESRWLFADVKRTRCGISAQAQGYGTGDMTWGGFAPGAYTVTASRDEQELTEVSVTAGDDGRLTAKLDANAIEPLDIAISCVTQDG